MKTRISLLALIIFVVISCGKDRFQTIPQLKLKSVTPDIVPLGSSLKINVEYTDKEGDVSDSLFLFRERLNKKKPLVLAVSNYNIPGFPSTDKGEFEVTLPYYTHLTVNIDAIPIPGTTPRKNEIDTMRLRIVAKDLAGNKSDTLTINNIYVIR